MPIIAVGGPWWLYIDAIQKQMENTYKAKTRTRYDVILTGLTGKTPSENQSQLDAVKQWTVGARIIVSGDAPKQSEAGYIKVERCRTSGEPLLREVFGNFMLETPAGKVIAICDHDCELGDSMEQLMEFIERGRMGLAWAAYAGDPWPKLFVMAAPVVPHFFRDIPFTLKFTDNAWKVWLNDWLNKNLTTFRYFNGNSYGLIKTPALPEISPVQNVYEVDDTQVSIEASEPVKTPKKARGRPRKVKP